MPVSAPIPSAPISGYEGPWLSHLGELGGQNNRKKMPRQQKRPFEYLNDAAEAVRYYGGPHVYDALNKVGSAFSMFSPGADIEDARKNYDSAIRNARKGNIPSAVGDAGWGLLSNLGFSEVSKPSQAIFAGVMARTADREKLRQAEQLARAGADRQTILNETGWFKGADDRGNYQKWRYEIDDSQARFKPEVRDLLRAPDFRRWRGKAADLIDHPALFEAYPQLADIRSTISYHERPNVRGFYSRAEPPEGNAALRVNTDKPKSPNVLKGLFHELQHPIQDIEGFAPGGNLDAGNGSWKVRQLAAERDELRHIAAVLVKRLERENFSPEKLDEGRNLLEGLLANIEMTENDILRARFKVYRDLRGEVEARNVSRRRTFTPTQRLATPPWKTEDTPRDRQSFVVPPNL